MEYTIARLDHFWREYIRTALWSSMDESDDDGGSPMDSNYCLDDISTEAQQEMRDDCRKFIQLADHLLEEGIDLFDDDDGRSAHDFWLTRNGHGCGFWDGDWPKNGDALTAICKQFGEVHLYLGDDGKIYQFSG